MKNKLTTLSLLYDKQLHIFVAQGTHGTAFPPSNLGRKLLTIGLEKAELSKMHEHALQLLMPGVDTPKTRLVVTRRARQFLSEAMQPIDTSRRMARDASAKPQQYRSQLTASNVRLKKEIERRIAAEETLRKKEQHVRTLLKQSLLMQAHLRQLSRDLLSAQEEERKTISRELHDDIAQTLMGINVHLATLKMEAAVNTRGLKKKIANTQRIVKRSVEIVHQFARNLRPTILDDLGLIPALTTLIKEFSKRTGIIVHFAVFAGIEQLPSDKHIAIYRVIQEALSNVARHAHAKRIKVSIAPVGNAAHLEIKDDGKSFQVQSDLYSKKNKRLGLLGMRERVEMVGGTFSIESNSGSGTAIRAQIPFNKTRSGKR